jgi:hypothetical protein
MTLVQMRGRAGSVNTITKKPFASLLYDVAISLITTGTHLFVETE